MRHKPKRTTYLKKRRYDHPGSSVIAFAIAAAAFLLWLYVQNQEFLEECARYGGC